MEFSSMVSFQVKTLKSKLAIFVFLFLLTPVLASAATITWSGGGADNNWNTALNWSGGSVPGSGDNVIFDGTSTKNCTINVNISVVSVTINCRTQLYRHKIRRNKNGVKIEDLDEFFIKRRIKF